MQLRLGIIISIVATSCSSSAKPELLSPPQTGSATVAGAASDAAVSDAAVSDAALVVVSPDAANATDDKYPRIFPWALWRERNEKWLANPSKDHCDPRNRRVPWRGPPACDPPSNVQLAAIITQAQRARHDDRKVLLTVDRGYAATVTRNYFISVLDGHGRPATRWVHPSLVDEQFSKFEVPIPVGVPVRQSITHAAIVERLTPDNHFPDNDPRGQP